MNYSLLTNTALFRGVKEDEIEHMTGCLNARTKKYKKHEIIYRSGDTVTEIGLVLSGSVNVVVNFYRGNSNIFAHIESGAIFAENYAAIPGKELLCDVVAAEDCEILFMDVSRLLTSCGTACSYHRRLIQNLFRISAVQNLNMSSRMMHIAPKSIRDKLLSYFSQRVAEDGSMHFSVPFSRQQLADYLGVDRSALSNELSKMQRDGLITYHKNEFTVKSGALDTI